MVMGYISAYHFNMYKEEREKKSEGRGKREARTESNKRERKECVRERRTIGRKKRRGRQKRREEGSKETGKRVTQKGSKGRKKREGREVS